MLVSSHACIKAKLSHYFAVTKHIERALEMMHCLNSEKTEMSVLERQRLRIKWQQEQFIHQLPVTYFNETEELGAAFLGDQTLSELVNGAMKPDPAQFFTSEFESHALPRTLSCPNPDIGKEAANMISGGGGRESSKKRKADKTHNLKVLLLVTTNFICFMLCFLLIRVTNLGFNFRQLQRRKR